jgi:hypothetical protein
MKILTATPAGQGVRQNDFDWCIEGEIVWVARVCDTDGTDPDGPCGCGRAFPGLNSHRATTTARVSDLPLSREEVIKAVAAYYEAAGHAAIPSAELEFEVDEVLDIASTWDVGTIVERRVWEIQPR